jgi:hypothetical protein
MRAWKQRLAGDQLAAVLRVGVLIAVLAALVIFSAVLRAQAHVDEVMQDAGAALFAYTREAPHDQPRTLLINGARLRVLSGSTSDAVKDALDGFDTRCRNVSGGAGQAWLEQRALLAAATPALRAALHGVLRVDDEHGGYVACFDLGGQHLTPGELTARVRAFLATGDLADIGGLRFAWARREAEHTTYVAVWSLDHLPLRSMFPARGDARGAELEGLPRPRGSQRVLSTWQEAEAPMLVGYRSARGAAALIRQYSTQLENEGWRVQTVRRASGPRRVLLRRRDALVAAVVADNGSGGSVLVLTPLR